MDIPSIETFLSVAEKQSFSITAEALYLTQPAISKRIAALEAELDCKLFDRVKKKIILTQAGRLFLPRAQNIINELRAGKNSLAEMGGLMNGELAMATSHHIGLHYLPPVLKQYVNEYPKVNLKLDFMDSEAACLAVENAEIELAVITLPDKPPAGINLFTIWTDPMTISIHNDHPLIADRHVKNENIVFHQENLLQLAEYPVILPEKGTYTRAILDNYFSRFDMDVQVKLANNYLETIKMMVSVGLGWSILPQTLIDDTLTSIQTPGETASRALGVAVHSRRSLSPAAQKMLDLIKISA